MLKHDIAMTVMLSAPTGTEPMGSSKIVNYLLPYLKQYTEQHKPNKINSKKY